jgi:hypothetical protein
MKARLITFIVFLASVVSFSACGILNRAQSPDEIAGFVLEAIDSRSFTVDVDHIIPLRGPSRHDFGYSVKVDGEDVISHLPFFGVSSVSTYNEGNPLSFEGKIQQYNCYQDKKGAFVIDFVTVNPVNIQVPIYYHLTIWGNGSTYITVNSPGRDSMSYSGNLVEPKDAE